MAAASQVVFVNRQTLERVMKKYPPDWSRRAHVVPQGHDGSAGTKVESPSPAPLRIVYTGRFYDGIRTPESFLRALAEADRSSSLAGRVDVEFVGARMDRYEALARELGLAGIVRFTGRMSPDRARDCAARADVLLVIDAPSIDGPSLFLPSKMIDYLPLGKPILAITPREGPVSDIIRELGYVAVDPADRGELVVALRSLVEAHERGTLSLSASHLAVARSYDIRETTAAFERVLDLARQPA